MLAKSQRLNLKTSFRWVASGNSYTSKNFKLFYRSGENYQPQIGVSIISAVFKKSTLRNQAKRVCFDMVQNYYTQLPKNLNLVIMPKAQVLNLPIEQLIQEFKDAISSFKNN